MGHIVGLLSYKALVSHCVELVLFLCSTRQHSCRQKTQGYSSLAWKKQTNKAVKQENERQKRVTNNECTKTILSNCTLGACLQEASERTRDTKGLGPSCVTVSQALWMNLCFQLALLCPGVSLCVYACICVCIHSNDISLAPSASLKIRRRAERVKRDKVQNKDERRYKRRVASLLFRARTMFRPFSHALYNTLCPHGLRECPRTSVYLICSKTLSCYILHMKILDLMFFMREKVYKCAMTETWFCIKD